MKKLSFILLFIIILLLSPVHAQKLNDASAYYNRGVAKAQLKNYKEAIEDYNKAISLNPKNASAYYNRGKANASIKNYNKAIEDYSKAKELDPTRSNEIDKAIQIINKEALSEMNLNNNLDFGVPKKPAIYLYPEKPTKVNITLDKNINLEVDIPKYAPKTGWNVLAHPDGNIKDLQPEFTNCGEIDISKLGHEYAKDACLQNNYPYVYWEGIQTKARTPISKEGWIVTKDELNNFLTKKLEYIGFNKSEKDEFIKYWCTTLTNKKETTFFIYFIQNEIVESYLPMKITPKPDVINRIYMVIEPNPDIKFKPKPQKLTKIIRQGFTVVDWGGEILPLSDIK